MPILDVPNDFYELPKGKLANVVTCLEMLGAPDRKLAELPGDATLVRFTGGDLESFRQLFRAVGSNLMWFSRLIMADEKLKSILGNPLIESYALMRDGRALGLLELNFTDTPHCELAFFGLVPEAIGGGLGRGLMDESIRRAWARPIQRYWVHTCTFDAPQALPFYMRSGFTPYTRMVEIHDDPRLQGKLPLSATPQAPVIQ